MRIFLTGASGFIGSHVARTLLEAGHEVAVLAMPDDSLGRLRDMRDRLVVITGGLADLPALRPALEAWQLEACIHMAWYAEPGKYLHSPENLSALMGSLTLLQELARVGCRQLVGAGTCAEYDTDRGYLREDGPTRPITLYAAAKLAFYQLGQHMAAAAGMRLAWGRIFYPYGPADDERRLVPAAIRALRSGQPFPTTQGEQVRDYVHVEDVARAFCSLAEKGADGVFNIASGVPVTIRQLLETLGALLGRTDLIQWGELPYRDWDPMFICGDNRRLKDLGWTPRYTLPQGLQHTCHWWSKRIGTTDSERQ